MKKNIFSCTIVITCLFLSACSMGENVQTEEEKRQIEFFQPKTNAIEFFDYIIEEFESEYPDIEVNQVNVPGGMEVLKTRIAHGDVPDIFITYPIEQDYVIRANKGYLLDITHEEFMGNIDATIQNRYLIDGKMYGVALSQNAVGVIYNKDIFEELELDVPKTWDQFIETLKKIEVEGKQPVLMANKDLERISVFNLSLIANEFDSSYWETLNNNHIDLKEDQRWIELSNKMLEFLDFAQEDSFSTEGIDVNKAFVNGEGVMSVIGVWEIPNLEKIDVNFNYGIFPFPATNDPERNKVLGGVDGGFAISADTKYPEEAKKFLEFLVKKENAQKFSDYEGNISAVQGVNMNNAEVSLLAEYMIQGKSVNWPNHYWIGGTAAEQDFRKHSQRFFFDRDIEAYLERLELMFENYRQQQ
ncbi:ABC transporter substrate-binding protein [Halalkalibacter kiskunsagensis]|uniref:ABC transporter substrate-binding protein n=1 Tax=Halalkalibacter kiskunsagensis TaxID=1548599 RepID=A0ABV6KD91_9BACI